MADIQLQTILSSGDVTQIKLDAIAVPPAHSEGLFYYNDDTKTIVLYNDISGTALDVGREVRRRVINNSGAQIDNGTPVKLAGIDAVTSLQEIEAATADTFINAFVSGITTHDIADGAQGEITLVGLINDMDTSGLVAGAPTFLAAAGGYTQTQPEIASVLGAPLIIHATAGVFLANIENLLALPVIFGAVTEKVAALDITPASTYVDIAGYTNGNSSIATVNATTGVINVPYDGHYRASFNLDMVLPGTNSGVDYLYVQIWNDTDSAQVARSSILLAPSAVAASRSICVPCDLLAAKDYKVRVQATEALLGVTFNMCTFDIQSLVVDVI